MGPVAQDNIDWKLGGTGLHNGSDSIRPQIERSAFCLLRPGRDLRASSVSGHMRPGREQGRPGLRSRVSLSSPEDSPSGPGAPGSSHCHPWGLGGRRSSRGDCTRCRPCPPPVALLGHFTRSRREVTGIWQGLRPVDLGQAPAAPLTARHQQGHTWQPQGGWQSCR